jgi:hypothetical protein
MLKFMVPGCACLALLIAAAPVAGQREARGMMATLQGGAMQYDLAGTGTRAFGAARLQVPVLRHFTVEPGVAYMNYRLQGLRQAPRIHAWFPEVQVQAELPLGGVAPYIGAGGGVAVESMLGERDAVGTASVAGGVRLNIAEGWRAGAELRVRAVDPFHGTTADWGLSLSRRL